MKVFTIAAIVTTVLCVSACGSSRQVVRESRYGIATCETKDSVKEAVMVELHDTIREVTTITIDRNEVGDTVKLVQIADRKRARDRDKIARQTTKAVVERDTVFVERRDSVATSSKDVGGQIGGTALHSTLKWVLFIILALIALKICPFFRRE